MEEADLGLPPLAAHGAPIDPALAVNARPLAVLITNDASQQPDPRGSHADCVCVLRKKQIHNDETAIAFALK